MKIEKDNLPELPSFVEWDFEPLRERGEILKYTLDNPEVPDGHKMFVERELGHIVFELWARNRLDI